MKQLPTGHWIPNQTLSRIDIIEESVHNEAARQLLLADIAIRRFKLCHGGAPPTSLAELSPDFLNAPNLDPITGHELLYRAGADGSYLLYSTGDDGRDDGGDPSPNDGNAPGLWNGRDIVWPTSAGPPKAP